MSTIDNSITARFWAFVDKKGPLCKHIGSCCWIWKGGKIRGYGHFWCNGKTLKAHRYVLQMAGANLNDIECVLHLCDNPSCVNPDHLKIGTILENRMDCVKKKRHAKGKTHMSVTSPQSIKRGYTHPKTKLTPELVNKIKSTYVKGSSTLGTYGLSKLFKVSQGTIWRIVSGRHFTADSNEFLEREKEFRARGGKFIFPLPKFEVV